MSLQEKGLEATSWSTHDPACNHCRERKVRCGREHPHCANCLRNGVQCDFSDHGKKVNHMKLLVNSVGGLEGRLGNIEKEIIRLNQTLRSIGRRIPVNENITRTFGFDHVGGDESSSLSNPQLNTAEKEALSFQQNRHVVVSQDNTERYHGPCTLLSLSHEFQNSVNKLQRSGLGNETGVSVEDPTRLGRCKELMDELCTAASVEETLCLDMDHLQVFLPPKQFLLMACATFFQLDDPAVDVFCQSSFLPNVDMVYSKPYTKADQSWALCFNTIILLVLDAEQPDTGGNISRDSIIGSQFAIPFISTIRLALASPDILLLPKLINVQALALLSVAAQQYLEPSLSNIFLAQACLLAKRMGLHQQIHQDAKEELSELDERGKVFISLFLRDKTNLLSRGIHCWLPSFDCDLSFLKTATIDSDMNARLHLAYIQEDIYRLIYSTEARGQPEASRRAAFGELEECLDQWTNTYWSTEETSSSPLLDLRLGLLASRIVALHSSTEVRHREQVVKDCRASCHLMVASAEDSRNSLWHSQSPGLDFGALPLFSSTGNMHQVQSLSTSSYKRPSSRLRSLAEGLAVPAFFGLVNNVIWPVIWDDITGDVRLLMTVSRLFQDLELKFQMENSARKISRAFQTLLQVTQVIRPELFSQNVSPSHIMGPKLSSIPPMTSYISGGLVGLPNIATTFSGSQSSAYSTTNTTRTNSPPFDLLQSANYDHGSGHHDLGQTLSSSPDHLNKRQCLVVPTAASSDDSINQTLFTYFPDMSPLIPLSGDKQDGAGNVSP